MIILHNYKGNEPATPTPIPGNPIFTATYTYQQIKDIMDREHDEGRAFAGIRFHFNTDNNAAAVPDDLVAVGVTTGKIGLAPEEICSPQSPDYILSDDKGAITIEGFLAKLQLAHSAKMTMVNFNPNRDACVYFSRNVIRDVIGDDNNPKDVALHLVDFTNALDANGNVVTLRSLIMCSVDNGTPSTMGFRSDLPCPPHCGTGYPVGGGSDDDD